MERLEKFEKMLSDIQRDYDSQKEQMAKLKASGKDKTATYYLVTLITLHLLLRDFCVRQGEGLRNTLCIPIDDNAVLRKKLKQESIFLSVTRYYKQYFANRLIYTQILSLYNQYGLIDTY